MPKTVQIKEQVSLNVSKTQEAIEKRKRDKILAAEKHIDALIALGWDMDKYPCVIDWKLSLPEPKDIKK